MANNLFTIYIWEVNTLSHAGRITLAELSRKWEVCGLGIGEGLPRKTFYNHCQKINEFFDISICCDKHTHEYHIKKNGDRRDDEIRNWLINNFSIKNALSETKNLKERIQFGSSPSSNGHLIEVIQAMKENRVIRMDYHSYWEEEAYTYVVEPYFVKLFRFRWYLIAHVRAKGTQSYTGRRMRTFGLDRIETMEITNENFNMPEDFNPDMFFRDVIGVIAAKGPAEKVRVKISCNQQKYFRTLKIHASQKETVVNEDYSIFEYHLYPTYDFLQILLSHGSAVEVMGPKWLRMEICQQAHETYQNYLK